LHLLGKCSTTWATLPALFTLVLFQVGSWVFVWSQLWTDSPTYVSHVAGLTGTYVTMPHLLFEMFSNFLLRMASE
jgi:hypothetical protein